jgi:hypothetical protein
MDRTRDDGIRLGRNCRHRVRRRPSNSGSLAMLTATRRASPSSAPWLGVPGPRYGGCRCTRATGRLRRGRRSRSISCPRQRGGNRREGSAIRSGACLMTAPTCTPPGRKTARSFYDQSISVLEAAWRFSRREARSRYRCPKLLYACQTVPPVLTMPTLRALGIAQSAGDGRDQPCRDEDEHQEIPQRVQVDVREHARQPALVRLVMA